MAAFSPYSLLIAVGDCPAPGGTSRLLFLPMKRSSFALLAVLAGGLTFANPTHGQTRSSVADTNPNDYVTTQERRNIRQEAARLAHEGVLLVRLTKDQQADNEAYSAAFRQEFNVAPVYFFSGDQAESVLHGDFTGLTPVSQTMNRAVIPGNFLIVDVDPGNYATTLSSAKNETLWRPGSGAAVAANRKNTKVDAVALRRSVAKLNRRLAKFATDAPTDKGLSSAPSQQ